MISEILWRNQGNVLTPELIVGLIHGISFAPDRSIPLDQFATKTCGSYVFAVERFAEAVEELKPLHAAHWAETEKHRNGIPLQYDYDGFSARDRAGTVLLFTIRKDGELVGHCTQKLFTSAHTGTLVADEDALFIRSDCRGGRTSYRFIGYMEDCLTQIGVREIRVSAKMVNAADKLLEKCGFKPVATQLVKLVGGKNETETSV
jgi:hypothetical protein